MEPFGFTLERPSSPLPTEYDFCPRGGRAAEAAWKCYGNLTLEQAYQRLLSNPVENEEQFAHMGPVAFDYYFPVIDRFLRGVDPRDQNDHREARALGYTISAQLVGTLEPSLKEEISDLVKHVLGNPRAYAHHKTGRRKLVGAWRRVETRLRRT